MKIFHVLKLNVEVNSKQNIFLREFTVEKPRLKEAIRGLWGRPARPMFKSVCLIADMMTKTDCKLVCSY